MDMTCAFNFFGRPVVYFVGQILNQQLYPLLREKAIIQLLTLEVTCLLYTELKSTPCAQTFNHNSQFMPSNDVRQQIGIKECHKKNFEPGQNIISAVAYANYTVKRHAVLHLGIQC